MTPKKKKREILARLEIYVSLHKNPIYIMNKFEYEFSCIKHFLTNKIIR